MLHASGVPTSDKGQGRGSYLSLSLSLSQWIVFHLTHSLLPQLIFSLNKKNEKRVNGKCVSEIYHLSDICLFFCFRVAAVDYLAKNVSLSTQRRMKLGDHSAVLGLLQVETGQAY